MPQPSPGQPPCSQLLALFDFVVPDGHNILFAALITIGESGEDRYNSATSIGTLEDGDLEVGADLVITRIRVEPTRVRLGRTGAGSWRDYVQSDDPLADARFHLQSDAGVSAVEVSDLADTADIFGNNVNIRATTTGGSAFIDRLTAVSSGGRIIHAMTQPSEPITIAASADADAATASVGLRAPTVAASATAEAATVSARLRAQTLAASSAAGQPTASVGVRGAAQLAVSAAAGQPTATVGLRAPTLAVSAAADAPTASARVNARYSLAVSATAGTPTASVSISGRPPLMLADSNDAGLDVVAKALLVASAPGTVGNDPYADSDRAGTDTPLGGELGLGTTDTVISRFRRLVQDELTLNDNDNPAALDIGAYFEAGGDGNDLTIYLRTTASGEVSFAVASQYILGGGGFARFTLPADAQALLDNLASEDRWIFKAARAAVILPITIAASANADACCGLRRLWVILRAPTVAASATAEAATVSARLRAQTLAASSAAGQPTASVGVRGAAQLAVSAAAGQPTATVGLRAPTLAVSAAADAPTASARVNARYSLAVSATAGTPTASVRPRSGRPPLMLADSNDAGLDVVAKALLVASAPGTVGNDPYADSDRAGTDTPLGGELGLGTTDTVISRFRRLVQDELTLNDNDNPAALDIGAYFEAGGDGNDLTIYLRTTASGEVSFAVASQYILGGGGFARFTLPADAQALLDNLASEDRWIFKAARAAVILPITIAASANADAATASVGLRAPTVAASATAEAATVSARLRAQTLAASSAAGQPTASVGVRGAAQLAVSAAAGQPTATVGLRAPTLAVSAAADAPTASARVNARYSLAVSATAGTPTASVSISGRPPLMLADSNDAGLDVVAKALLVASAPGTVGNDPYADSDRAGTDTPLAGELGLGTTDTVISRFRRLVQDELTLNDNDNPAALDIGAYFEAGGDGNDLTIYLRTTASGEVSFAVASQYILGGGGFARFTLPADAQALLDNLASEDRWIFKAARAAVILPITIAASADADAATASVGLRAPTVAASATAEAATVSARLRAQTLAASSAAGQPTASVGVRGAAQLAVSAAAGQPTATVGLRAPTLAVSAAADAPTASARVNARYSLAVSATAGTPTASVSISTASPTLLVPRFVMLG